MPFSRRQHLLRDSWGVGPNIPFSSYSPDIFSPVGLEEVLVSLLRQEGDQLIVGPAGGFSTQAKSD